MEIKKELLENQLGQMKARLENSKASVNQLTGAIVVIEDLLLYLAKEEEVQKPQEDISAENAAIQESLENARVAYTEEEFAEAVAGNGAVVEGYVPQPDYPVDYYNSHKEPSEAYAAG